MILPHVTYGLTPLPCLLIIAPSLNRELVTLVIHLNIPYCRNVISNVVEFKRMQGESR